jgi:hypothetical protein
VPHRLERRVAMPTGKLAHLQDHAAQRCREHATERGRWTQTCDSQQQQQQQQQ